MAGVETLRAWLLDAGGIKLKHVDGVLAKLEEELVDDVADLAEFAELPRFDACLPALAASRIRGALRGAGAPSKLAGSVAAAIELTPTRTLVLTPPSTPRKPPRSIAASISRAADVEANTANAARLQAATRGWLARRGLRRLGELREKAADEARADWSAYLRVCWASRRVARLQRGLRRRWWLRSLVNYDVPEGFWGGKTEKVDVEANLPCLQGQELEPSAMNSKSAVTSQLPPLAPMVLHGCTTPRSAEGSIVGIHPVYSLGSSGLTARSIPAIPPPNPRLAQLITDVRARRQPLPEKDSRGVFILDSHLPKQWRLETCTWAKARALPSTVAGYTASEGASYGWSHFFSRVLPQPGANSCIHNEDITEPAFDMSAPPETRAASLRALGWPEGCLPDKPALLAHMLHSVEYEYAAHCFYDHVPGKRCSECSFDPKKTKASLYAMTCDSDSDDAPYGGVDRADDCDAMGADLPDSDGDETDLSAGFCSAEPAA
jgi:hypothetical protein